MDEEFVTPIIALYGGLAVLCCRACGRTRSSDDKITLSYYYSIGLLLRNRLRVWVVVSKRNTGLRNLTQVVAQNNIWANKKLGRYSHRVWQIGSVGSVAACKKQVGKGDSCSQHLLTAVPYNYRQTKNKKKLKKNAGKKQEHTKNAECPPPRTSTAIFFMCCGKTAPGVEVTRRHIIVRVHELY